MLLIAIPRAGRALVAELTDRARAADLAVKVLPSNRELLDGAVRLADIRDLTLSDLLGRREVQTEVETIAGYLTGKRVLVTGAGGSIGSELCRQIQRFAPAELMMLDRDESALHGVQLSIEQRALLEDTDRCSLLLADIRDTPTIAEIFRTRAPQVVFHAAALKHLPLLERFPREALRTNVFSTLDLLEMACRAGVERFVNVSTDKAADPTSVLGYTKRISERLTADVATRSEGVYLSVRFGNVLGSRGSVLETFQAQIASGGPITVTDPEVTRFFMTTAEAVELLIQAGGIGRPGEVLVLDMGDPVRIADVARRLVELTQSDVDIVFTGLRPGEKADEVLFGAGEVDFRPVHPLIAHVSVPPLAPSALAGAHAAHTVDPSVAVRVIARARHRARQSRRIRAQSGSHRSWRRCAVRARTSSWRKPRLRAVADVVAAPPGARRFRQAAAREASLGGAGRRLPILLASRVIEQCVLGGAALLLAARLGLDAFAPVSALLVVNSAAVTLSDYGIGLAALRCPPGHRVALRSLQRMRLVNLAILAAGVVAGIAAGGTVGVLVAASAAIWCVSAEAFVRKAAAIANGHGRESAVAELMGSAVFALPVLALATGSRALAVVGAALVLKHVVEAVVAHSGRSVFGPDGAVPRLRSLCSTQVLAYGLGNIDYVIVAVVLGASAFSVYSLAYRVAVAVPSVVAYVATRTAVADLSSAAHQAERQARYSRYVQPLFLIGVASAVLAAAIGLVLPSLLGNGWDALRTGDRRARVRGTVADDRRPGRGSGDRRRGGAASRPLGALAPGACSWPCSPSPRSPVSTSSSPRSPSDGSWA